MKPIHQKHQRGHRLLALALGGVFAASLTLSFPMAHAWDLGLGKKEAPAAVKEVAPEADSPEASAEEKPLSKKEKAQLEKAARKKHAEDLVRAEEALEPKTAEEFYEKGLDLFKIAQFQAEKGNLNGQKTLLREAITAFEHAVALAVPKTETPKADAKKDKKSGDKKSGKKPDEPQTAGDSASAAAEAAPVTFIPTASKPVPRVAVEAQSNIGFAYLTLKQYREAAKAFQAALGFNPKHLNTLNGLATTYAYDKKEDEALKTFEELTTLDPGNPQFFFNQGSVLQRFNRHDEAKAAYEAALKLEPRDQRTLFNLATLYENMGDLQQARPYYVKAKDVAIETPVGLEAYHRIELIDLLISQQADVEKRAVEKPKIEKKRKTRTDKNNPAAQPQGAASSENAAPAVADAPQPPAAEEPSP